MIDRFPLRLQVRHATKVLDCRCQRHNVWACREVVGQLKCPAVDREEIVNACGVDDLHDGANVIRTAVVVGTSKARETLEPFLGQLGRRLAHVMSRMLPISMYLLQKDGTSLHTGPMH